MWAIAYFLVSKINIHRIERTSIMRINEIITRDPEVIRPDAVLVDAAQKMKALDIGTLPVCEGDRLVGMISDRDITVRCVAQNHDPKTARVHEVMTPEVIYCFDDE